ncbi:hypothetical protein [Planktothrix sp. FACHB-1355]|uniref:hypothetical protein n=1 Tax=Planktothrix sp. FACHB-1355 TaxID=2692854 RepID=UPI00168B2BD4|nr:hypothetical protein [Planktothrix sp. FACHB-1355]
MGNAVSRILNKAQPNARQTALARSSTWRWKHFIERPSNQLSGLLFRLAETFYSAEKPDYRRQKNGKIYPVLFVLFAF